MLAYEPKELLGEIRKYMFIHDISQDDLAQTMHRSKQTVSNIFKNGNPTLETIFCMLDALGLELDYRFIEKELEYSNDNQDDYSYEEEQELYY